MAPRAAARLETLGFNKVYEYKAGKLDWLAAGLPTEGENSKRPRAADVARKDVVTCGLQDRLGEVRQRAASAGGAVVVVTNGAGIVLGLLRAKELGMDPDLIIERAMRPGPSTFRPYVSIKEMADYMVEHKLESSPITASDGKLIGVLYRSDATDQAADCPDCARKMISV